MPKMSEGGVQLVSTQFWPPRASEHKVRPQRAGMISDGFLRRCFFYLGHTCVTQRLMCIVYLWASEVTQHPSVQSRNWQLSIFTKKGDASRSYEDTGHRKPNKRKGLFLKCVIKVLTTNTLICPSFQCGNKSRIRVNSPEIPRWGVKGLWRSGNLQNRKWKRNMTKRNRNKQK